MADPRDVNLIEIFGRAALKRMRRSGVAIIGLGLLGGRLALELGALGVPLTLVDPDIVDAPNTANQLFPAKSVGQPKVHARAEQIREINPAAQVVTKFARVEDIGLGAFAGLALFCGALDGRAARVYLGGASHRLQIPYIDTAVDGSGQRLLGTVTHWDPSAPDAPCAACRYSNAEMARIRFEGRGPGCGSSRTPNDVVTRPTLVAGPFGDVIAGHALTWAVDVLLGRSAAHANMQLRVSSNPLARCEHVSVTRSKHCAEPHVALHAPRRVAAGTIEELWREASRLLGGEPDSLLAHDRAFIVRLPCAFCGSGGTSLRIAGAFGANAPVCRCPAGAPKRPTQSLARLSRAEMLRFAGTTWSEIGLPTKDLITAQRDRRQVHFFVGRRPSPDASQQMEDPA